MPDIDIDFSDERRDEVIDYVVRKYGSEHVAQIITFGTMAAKAAVRDVGRVLNCPTREVDRTAKLIPNQLGITLERRCTEPAAAPKLAATNDEDGAADRDRPQAGGHAAACLDPCRRRRHLPRTADGLRAAAGKGRSRRRSPSIRWSIWKRSACSRWISWACERCRSSSGRSHSIEAARRRSGRSAGMPDDDPLTYELLSRGDTTGIFQLESPGMRRVLRELKPSQLRRYHLGPGAVSSGSDGVYPEIYSWQARTQSRWNIRIRPWSRF